MKCQGITKVSTVNPEGRVNAYMVTLSLAVKTFYPKPQMSTSVWHLKTIEVIRLHYLETVNVGTDFHGDPISSWDNLLDRWKFCPAGGPRRKGWGITKEVKSPPETMNVGIKCQEDNTNSCSDISVGIYNLRGRSNRLALPCCQHGS